MRVVVRVVVGVGGMGEHVEVVDGIRFVEGVLVVVEAATGALGHGELLGRSVR